MKAFTWLFLASAIAVAQPISFGVKVGSPVNDAFDVINGRATYLPSTQRFIVGPTVELRIPFLGFGIEFDALYRRYSYDYSSGLSAGTPGTTGSITTAQTKTGEWEFPILLKYRIGFPLVKPYVVGGLAFNRLSGVKHALSCLGGDCSSTSATDVNHQTSFGIVFGAGVQVGVGKFKLAPEIRYTRWALSNFDVAGAFGSALTSNKNQAEFLVGFTF